MSTADQLRRLNRVLADRYRAERRLGEGGMATVYLARDLRHDRPVALKVLKPELAAVVGHERFLTEIATTANLQHPHVLPLFDSGEADGLLFYVMPYVEGESLRQRLDREHQLPVHDAVRIAREMAEALDHTHRHGVIHRDIKPGNVLLIDGKAVISDFGIALAVGAAGGDRLTETGMSLGTPHYMSPEQATGDVSVGAASDIYAVGCVLYEMLTGEPPYTGGTPQAVLGRIITGEVPSARAERATVPANVDAAIRRALEKIPADRFGRAEELARALADPTFRHGEEAAARRSRRGSWPVLVLSAACLVLAAALLLSLTSEVPPGPPERFVVPFEPGTEPTTSGGDWALLPDGSGIVYRAAGALQLRPFSGLTSTTILATANPTFSAGAVSPDGDEVAFRTGNEIRVMGLDGGATRTLMEGRFAGWGDDGYVYVSTEEGLDRVRAEGGPPEQVTRLGEGEVVHRFSDALPGGILLEVAGGQGRSLDFVDLSSFERTVLVPDGFDGRWRESGHLLYLAEGMLTADVFDPDTRRLGNRPTGLLAGVGSFDLAVDGRLVYRELGGGPGLLEFVWVSRSGEVEPVIEGWYAAMDGVNVGWTLSREDREILFNRWNEGNWDIWIMTTATGELRRLTDHPAQELVPRWSPDESAVTFASQRADSLGGPWALWSVPRDGGEAASPLFTERPVAAGVWSPDGRWLVVRTTTGPQGADVPARDILGIRPGVDSVPRPLAASPDAEEAEPEISPDGRWLAYSSNATGQVEVFVQPFPEADGARWQISLDGGILPLWSHGGEELFFVRPETRELVSVRRETSDSWGRISRQVLMVVPSDMHLRSGSEAYDLSADGRRFLMARTPDQVALPAPRLFVIDNWAQEMERQVPR